MKILILALSGIGDALMATPALRVIKEHKPSAQIDVLTMFKAGGDIFRNNPDKDKFIDFVIDKWVKQGKENFSILDYLEKQKNSR